MSDWQPIETAPWGHFLAWVPFGSGDGDGAYNLLCKNEDGNWINDNGDDIAPYKPTHWMPLPAPPTIGDDRHDDGAN